MKTLNYIGCKKTLFPILFRIIQTEIGELHHLVFGDLFAGTGIVGKSIEPYVKKVISNDLEYYSYVINKGLLDCDYSVRLQSLIDTCNELVIPNDFSSSLHHSLITTEYSGDRMFFTTENAQRADTVRTFLDELKNSHSITNREYFFLLSSLLVSLDKVANTASVYGAFLKEYKASAKKKLIIEPIHTTERTEIKIKNEVYQSKVEDLISSIYCDIVYLDPPYNQRQYSSNYSPLNFIAEYSSELVVKGKTGLIDGYNRSDFCSKPVVKKAFEKVIKGLNCKYLFLSYNDEGLLSKEDLKQILLTRGNLTLYSILYKKFKSNSRKEEERTVVTEYLWFLQIDEAALTQGLCESRTFQEKEYLNE